MQIEKIQKRAIHIIFNATRGMPYNSMLYIEALTLWLLGEMISVKNSFNISHNRPLASIVFFPLQENSLLFHALSHLQNTPEFTPVLSATVLSLITPSAIIRIK